MLKENFADDDDDDDAPPACEDCRLTLSHLNCLVWLVFNNSTQVIIIFRFGKKFDIFSKCLSSSTPRSDLTSSSAFGAVSITGSTVNINKY